jgi:hypothetical protein
MERGLLLQNPSSSLLTVGPRMPLDKIDLFDDQFLLLWKDLQDPATLPLFLPVDHHYQIVLFDMKFWDAHFKFHSSCGPERLSQYLWS